MSVGFYATLAGERLNSANHNYEQARYWNLRAIEFEKKLDQANLRIEGLEHRLQQAEANNAAWQAHAKQLEEKIREWQQSALEYEAMNRAKSAVVEDKFGKGIAELAEIDSATAEKYFEEKKQELIQEWGINPWKTDKS